MQANAGQEETMQANAGQEETMRANAGQEETMQDNELLQFDWVVQNFNLL